MALKKKEEQKVLEVNAAMQGELTFKDPVNLTINGTFQGQLSTKGTLLIGERAFVRADILGEDITIAGKVEGNIVAEKKLSLIPPANIQGEIKSPLLVVEEGAILNGHCKMSNVKEGYLTLEEMTSYLQIDKETLLRWAEEKKVSASKEGDTYLFNSKEVENWLSKEKIS